MDDLISRQAAIEAMTADNLSWNLDSVHDDDMKRAARAAQRALARIPAAQRWIAVTERLPGEFVSVQAHMTDAEPFPSVREAYLAGGEWFFPALNEYHPVDKWAEFLESSEEKCYVQEKVR